MQEQAIEPRFHVNRIGRSDPGARAVARLAPHAQCGQAFDGLFPSQRAEHLCQQVLGRRHLLELCLRQPAQQLAVAKPPAHRRQQHDGSRIVIG